MGSSTRNPYRHGRICQTGIVYPEVLPFDLHKGCLMDRKTNALRREFELWPVSSITEILTKNVEAVLGAVTHLPVRFWRPHMFFTGAKDEDLSVFTNGQFPKKTVSRKSHPVFSLRKLPQDIGFTVCPCTSSRPFKRGGFRYIHKGCKLSHTNHVMDRDSFLVEKMRFNIPPSVAYRLRFKGEVPDRCLKR